MAVLVEFEVRDATAVDTMLGPDLESVDAEASNVSIAPVMSMAIPGPNAAP